MLPSDYPGQTCSIARSLEAIGERWTLLIVREVLLGTTRFDDLADRLGVTRTVLARRLQHLVAEGILERTAYQQHPERFAYTATGKGRALVGVLAALMHWGDTYYPHPAGPPRQLIHRDCGGPVHQILACAACRQELAAADIDTIPGPALATPAQQPTGHAAGPNG